MDLIEPWKPLQAPIHMANIQNTPTDLNLPEYMHACYTYMYMHVCVTMNCEHAGKVVF
jgi:hypothetical protein